MTLRTMAITAAPLQIGGPLGRTLKYAWKALARRFRVLLEDVKLEARPLGHLL